jgi:hypothetical protein
VIVVMSCPQEEPKWEPIVHKHWKLRHTTRNHRSHLWGGLRCEVRSTNRPSDKFGVAMNENVQ